MCGDKVAVLSKFGGTVSKLPSYLQEFPMFPGIGNHYIVLKDSHACIHDSYLHGNKYCCINEYLFYLQNLQL